MTIARLGLLALALLTPLLIAKQGRDLKLFAVQLLALFALTVATSRWLLNRDRSRLSPVLLPLGAWLAALIAAGYHAGSPAALDELVRQCSFLAIVAAASLACSRADLKRVLLLWSVTFVCVGGYALVQRLGYEPNDEFRRWHSQARVFSTFGNPSFLGTHTAFLLPLFVGAAAAGSGNRNGRLLWSAVAALTLLILYWTFSRGAWLGAAAGLAAFACCAFPWRDVQRALGKLPKGVIALVVILVTVVLVAVIPREHLQRRTDRLPLWQGTLNMIKAKPLGGWGLGAFPAEYRPFAPPAFAKRMQEDNTFAEHPHCEYMHVAVESGITGLGLFIWLLTCLVRQAAWRGRNGDRLAAAALGALVAVLVHIAVDRNFRLASTAGPFWLLAGLLYSGRLRETLPVPWTSFRPRIQKVPAAYLKFSAIVLCAGLCLSLISWTLRPLIASHRVAGEQDFLQQATGLSTAELELLRTARQHDPVYFMELGNAYAKERRFEKAVTAFRHALRLDPTMVSAANNLGNSYFMMSEFDQAITAYRRVLASNPEHQDARFNMAFAYFHQRKIKEALAECQRLLRQNPQNPKALQLMQQLTP